MLCASSAVFIPIEMASAQEGCPMWLTGTLGQVPVRAVLTSSRENQGELTGRLDTPPSSAGQLPDLLGISHVAWTGGLCVSLTPSGSVYTLNMKPETVGNGYLLIENAHCSTSGWGLATPGILGQLSSQSSSGQIRTLVGTVQTGGDDLPLRLEEAEPEISCLGGSEIIDSCGDGGCVPNVVLVAVSPRRTEEAEAEFRRQEAFEIERCQSRDECPMAPNVPENAVRYILQVPGLREETVAENLRRLPYILAAERATADAGAPAEGITLTSSRFFNNLPPDDAVARNRIQQAFARYFRASGLRFQVLNRSAFFYRVEIEGPSRFLAKGQPNAWERLVFEVILTHLFSRGGKDDMLTVFLSVPSAKWAVWPDGQKPNPARLKEFEGPELSALQVRLLSQLSMDVAPGRARGK